MAFSLGEKSPEHYCGSCLAVPGIWQYASLEDCICDCHQKAVPPLHMGSQKKCDLYDHSWTVVAASDNKKYYECEWCDATMQHPKEKE